MSKKFILNEDCFLIKGAKRGAIYSLYTGEVYSIDDIVVSLLEQCEAGKTIKAILENCHYNMRNTVIQFFDRLEKMRLGTFLGENKKITKISINTSLPVLEFIWLEITDICNLYCSHCYADSSSKLLRHKLLMGENDWIRIMREAYEIGCRKIQFIGGEPFIVSNQLLRLIKIAKKYKYEFVEVYTNATLIDDAAIEFLARQNVNVAVSVYGDNPVIHDAVTRRKGSFNKTIETLRKLVERGVQTRIGLIGMSINENYVEQTIKFLKDDIGVENVKLDIVRPSGRGCNGELTPTNLIRRIKLKEPLFPKCTVESFQRARFGHNCFSKKICVTASGNIFPCIMERNRILGNIFNESLKNILYGMRAQEIRGISKDFIEVCRDCEYRYCCFDCRPRANGVSPDGNFFAKPVECLYNPYLGEWGE